MAAYATLDQFWVYGLPQKAVEYEEVAAITAAIDSASRTIDSYLAPRYPVPLARWPELLIRHTCSMALWYFMSQRGFDTDGPDEVVRVRHDDAIRWCKDVAAGRASIIGVAAENTNPVPDEATFEVVDSEPLRGW